MYIHYVQFYVIRASSSKDSVDRGKLGRVSGEEAGGGSHLRGFGDKWRGRAGLSVQHLSAPWPPHTTPGFRVRLLHTHTRTQEGCQGRIMQTQISKLTSSQPRWELKGIYSGTCTLYSISGLSHLIWQHRLWWSTDGWHRLRLVQCLVQLVVSVSPALVCRVFVVAGQTAVHAQVVCAHSRQVGHAVVMEIQVLLWTFQLRTESHDTDSVLEYRVTLY